MPAWAAQAVMPDSHLSFLQLFGIGTALAILIDAILVRGVLVPALMCLAGPLNWWAPPRSGASTTPSACPRSRQVPPPSPSPCPTGPPPNKPPAIPRPPCAPAVSPTSTVSPDTPRPSRSSGGQVRWGCRSPIRWLVQARASKVPGRFTDWAVVGSWDNMHMVGLRCGVR